VRSALKAAFSALMPSIVFPAKPTSIGMTINVLSAMKNAKYVTLTELARTVRLVIESTRQPVFVNRVRPVFVLHAQLIRTLVNSVTPVTPNKIALNLALFSPLQALYVLNAAKIYW